jgi:broad specificity phosphatase PhoE
MSTSGRHTRRISNSRSPASSNDPVVSIIVTHQNRIRCLLSELLDDEVHRFKNAAIVKLIIKNDIISVELVHDGELTKPQKGKKYYTKKKIKRKPVNLSDNINKLVTDGNIEQLDNFLTQHRANPKDIGNNNNINMLVSGAMNGGSPCVGFESYNEYSTLCTSNSGINNVIKINGDGKCGWYSIFVYLKLLYLHHIHHFDQSDQSGVLTAIRNYFDKHTDIFEMKIGISVKDSHFIKLINILGIGYKLVDGEYIMDDENDVILMLKNYSTQKRTELKQFDFIGYSSFIRKHILAPMYLINNMNGKNVEYMRHVSYMKNDLYNIPPLIMIRSDEHSGAHFELIDNVTKANKNDIIYSNNIDILPTTVKTDFITKNYIDVLEQLNSKRYDSSSLPVPIPPVPIQPTRVMVTNPTASNTVGIKMNRCSYDDCTIYVKNFKIKKDKLDNREYHFYLIRHGEATHNLYKKYNVFRKYDTSLTQTGLIQASRAGDSFGNPDGKINANYIFVSDLKRTHQTLEQIYDKLKPNINKVFVLPCAHELKYKKGTKTRKKGYCDGSQDFSQYITNENKTSCKYIDKCDKKLGENVLDWKYYDLFYNKSKKDENIYQNVLKKGKRKTRRKSRKTCKNTNMIEQAIKIISDEKNKY